MAVPVCQWLYYLHLKLAGPLPVAPGPASPAAGPVTVAAHGGRGGHSAGTGLAFKLAAWHWQARPGGRAPGPGADSSYFK
jgi:hypothetical protein